jgi:hypothetical protein
MTTRPSRIALSTNAAKWFAFGKFFLACGLVVVSPAVAGQAGRMERETGAAAPRAVAFADDMSVAGISYTEALLPPGEGKNVAAPDKKEKTINLLEFSTTRSGSAGAHSIATTSTPRASIRWRILSSRSSRA